MNILEEWINPVYLGEKRVKRLARNFRRGKPFPHVALTAFLKEDKMQRIEDALRQQEFFRKESDLFSFWQTHNLLTVEDPVISEFVEFISSAEFLNLIMNISEQVLNGEIDAMGAMYKDTDHLLCHDDQLEKRKIAYIFNLSRDFTKKSGGALALLNSRKDGSPFKVKKRIIPAWNTLSFFTVTPESHHLVEEVLEEKQRITIGGWLHG